MNKNRSALAVILLAALTIAAGKPKDSELWLDPVAAGAQGAEGFQFVRADRTGNVFLFRSDRGEVSPLLKNGELGEVVRLKVANAPLGFVVHAALSPDGSQWLFYAEGKLRLFLDGKEKPLPPIDWQPWAVGFLRDTPLAVVMPRPLPSATLRLQDLGVAPWLVRFDNDRWSAWLSHPDLDAETAWRERSRMNAWVAEYSSLISPARDGKLWMASEYAYALRRLSPSGKTLSEVTVAKSKGEESPIRITPRGDAAAAVKRMEAQGGSASFHEFKEQAVIADLAEKSGFVYLLVHAPGSKLALDRYDPAQERLDRIPLAVRDSGRFTLACGKDGLYIASITPAEGVWRASWSALDSAEWKPVKGAKLPGGSAEAN
ncbi:MAG: hypothetical protein ABUT39_26900 [Acidobacteriota bacterium]